MTEQSLQNSSAILEGKRTTYTKRPSEELLDFWNRRAKHRTRPEIRGFPMAFGSSGIVFFASSGGIPLLGVRR